MPADGAARPAVDFASLFRSAPDRCLVLAPDLTIVEVSDGYLAATMTRREDVVGRPLVALFADDPADPDADGVAGLRASLQRALVHRRPDEMPVQRYPIRVPASRGHGVEERFWAVLNRPVLGPDGGVAYLVHRVEDVTDVVRLERANRQQERALGEVTARSDRYSSLLEAAPDAIVIMGEDGRIEMFNAQAERLFGYGRDEVIGRDLDLLIPERFRRTHVAHVSSYLAGPLARPMGSALQLYARRKDGGELPIEVSLSPQRDADGVRVSAAIRDVSERKRLEATSRVMAERLASAVESIQDAFALYDADDRLILCNSVFRRLLREDHAGPLIGRTFAEVLDLWIDDIDLADAEARAAFRAERIARRRTELTCSFDVRMRDGRRLRVMDRRTPEGGNVKTIWDLTDEEHRAEELREARSAAEAASDAKSEFLSSMSHELRTPLNAILGFAQLLQRDRREPLGDRHRERVEQILKGGEHLLRLIDDILDLARIESGRISLSLEAVDVAEVLAEVRATLDPIAAQRGVALVLAPVPGDLPRVHADRTRFAQILMNYGSNGIKYNRPDGRVGLVARAIAGDRVRVEVSDSGMGIPLDKQERLFQPFQRAGQETGPIEGTGIGLVITKRLAELMDGTVGFSSRPGEGSTFWVEIPVHVERGAGASPVVARTLTTTIDPTGGVRHLVLYVEDNPANVVFMRDLVSSLAGIDLLTVPTAELGVELARARRPAVIIMDINLPGMSGIEALRVLRSLPETRSIPVIALTAAASERDRRRGEEAGFHRYLTKPVQVDELVDALERLLAVAPSPP